MPLPGVAQQKKAAMSDIPHLCDDAETRRRFLENATTIMLGAMSLTVLSGSGSQVDAADAPPDPKDKAAAGASKDKAKKKPVYGFLVDTQKCIGSGKCLTACRQENEVPEGFSRTWVERYIHFKDGTVRVDLTPEAGFHGSEVPPVDPDTVERAYFVPKLCNHCHEAPCNQVCPVHASFTSPEGFELIDATRCIGCAYCVQACPYGARYLNPKTGTADKCTWCYHRVMRDQQPACVEACPTGARLFGRLDDPNSEISKRLSEVSTSVLKSHLGTRPKTCYSGITDEVT